MSCVRQLIDLWEDFPNIHRSHTFTFRVEVPPPRDEKSDRQSPKTLERSQTHELGGTTSNGQNLPDIHGKGPTSTTAREESPEPDELSTAIAHPLFEGTSQEFMKPFDVQTVGQCEVKTEYACDILESSLTRPRSRVLLVQGRAPEILPGMLLTPIMSSKSGTTTSHWDLMQRPTCFLARQFRQISWMTAEPTEPAGFEQVVLSTTAVSPLTVRLCRSLEVLFTRYSADFGKMKDTACKAATGFCRAWLTSPGYYAKAYVNLFVNLTDEFRYALLAPSKIQLIKAEAEICKEGDVGDSCFFVFAGEAGIYCRHAFAGRLSQLPGTKAWESWRGELEVGGSCLNRVASVTAYTDCGIWEPSAKAIRDLRLLFPYECSFFDKVAMNHLQLLFLLTDRVSEINTIENCSAEFCRVIRGLMVQKVHCRREVVMQESNAGNEMYVLCVGKCSVFRGYNSELSSHLHPGSCFGGLAVLNSTRRRTATIKAQATPNHCADCICDLRALTRPALLEALAQYPGDKDRVREVIEAHSQSRQATASALRRAGASDGSISCQFLQILLDNMHEQAFLAEQTSLQEGKESFLTVLLHGMVEVEVRGVHIANIVAPAIFGERGIVEPGTPSAATVRSCAESECMVLPASSAAVPILQARLPEDTGESATQEGVRAVGQASATEAEEDTRAVGDSTVNHAEANKAEEDVKAASAALAQPAEVCRMVAWRQ